MAKLITTNDISNLIVTLADWAKDNDMGHIYHEAISKIRHMRDQATGSLRLPPGSNSKTAEAAYSDFWRNGLRAIADHYGNAESWNACNSAARHAYADVALIIRLDIRRIAA